MRSAHSAAARDRSTSARTTTLASRTTALVARAGLPAMVPLLAGQVGCPRRPRLARIPLTKRADRVAPTTARLAPLGLALEQRDHLGVQRPSVRPPYASAARSMSSAARQPTASR